MATWYELQFGSINPVEVERETESSLVINRQRRPKRSSWRRYFRTRQEAIDDEIARRELAVKRARECLVDCENALEQARKL
jgi:hypothetical protein